MKISFVVPGVPVPKGRTRAFVRNGVVRHVTPEKTVQYENQVALACHQAMPEPLRREIGVCLTVVAYMPIPKSWPERKRDDAALGYKRHTSKPDLDNIVKAVLDGMNGVAWIDDSQVCLIRAQKCYSEEPRVQVVVEVE